jgi:hypothetical protein
MVLEKTHGLSLLNDSNNEMLYVIACIIRVCKMESLQAEQCVILAHNKDSYEIANSDYINVLEMHEELKELNIKSEIHENSLY